MSFLHGNRRLRFLIVALAMAAMAMPITAQPAAASERISRSFFGMTDGDPTSWPVAPVGALRLWDSGVTWRQIEVRPGVFSFTGLDQQVRVARANGARPLLVLGMTPRFHAVRPNTWGVYGSGSASVPKTWAWKRYVAKVVGRYGSRVDYQVWNEANVGSFWAGTPAKMAELTKIASRVVAAKAPAARVVSPALAVRLTGQRKWLRDFYAQRVGGRRVAGWVDVVSLNLYPLPGDGPEDSRTLLAASRTMLRAAGVRKPIWNTEINYGLKTGGGGVARDISREKEAAFVARTYILNAADGVKRVFWYSWQLQDLANTEMTLRDGVTRTRAGIAYSVVYKWLAGTRMQGCSRDGRGTYLCTVKASDGVRRIIWNPSRKVTYRTMKSATRWTGLQGVTHPLNGGESLRVGQSPVMVRSAR